MRKAVIFGAGGHAKVVAEILQAAGKHDVIGFLDDRPELQGRDVLTLPVLGDRNWLRERAREAAVALGIGVNNAARREIASFVTSCGAELITAIHPSATVSPSAELAAGTVVMPGAIINAGAQIGAGCVINTGAVIEHGAVVEEFCFISPNSTIGGDARIGALTLVGIAATVLPGINVGRQTVVGAGAVVTTNLPEGVIAAGVPARVRAAVSMTG